MKGGIASCRVVIAVFQASDRGRSVVLSMVHSPPRKVITINGASSLDSPPNVLHALLPFRTMIAAAITPASALVSGRLVKVPLLSRRQLKTTNRLHRLQRPC